VGIRKLLGKIPAKTEANKSAEDNSEDRRAYAKSSVIPSGDKKA
jgi:hypothetical protein